MRRYIMTIIDPNSRITLAVAISTKHATNDTNDNKFSILSDNGSEFMKDLNKLL